METPENECFNQEPKQIDDCLYLKEGKGFIVLN